MSDAPAPPPRSTHSRIHLRDVSEPSDTPIIRAPSRHESSHPVPDRIARYGVMGEIARGGVGAVLKARDPDLGRDIALKVLLEEHGNDRDLAARLIEEAQICGQLQHPGIVPVHEVGLTGGRPYFTMKLVKGRTLAAILAERPHPSEGIPRSIAIFEGVCRTVAHAHARGVIHRDLKPANIMVGPFGEVHVMDWGLAKVTAAEGAGSALGAGPPEAGKSRIATLRSARPGKDGGNRHRHPEGVRPPSGAEEGEAAPPIDRETRSLSDSRSGSESIAGSILGTPAYMSPEQARGDVDDVDARSDVFGLGAILCEILTGRPPYTGEGVAEVENQARKGYLDDAGARLDGCGADPALVSLARKCLAFEPRDRPADAGGVAAEIARWREGIEERRRSSELEAARIRARAAGDRKVRRLTITLAALIALAAAGGGGGHIWMERIEDARTAAAARAVHEALDEARELRSLATGDAEADLSRWKEALSATFRAEGRAREAGEAGLLAAASALREEIEEAAARARERADREEREKAAIERLEAARSDDPAWDRPGVEIRRALLDLGIDVEAGSEEEAAARIAATGIAGEIARALDAWAAWSREFHGERSAGWRRLLGIARRADPDPWRGRLRKAVEEDDRSEIRRLGAEMPIGEVPPATLVFLAASLKAIGETDRATALTREAILLHPGDFQVQSSRVDMAAQTAALAIRPWSPAAGYRLAQIWYGRNDGDLQIAFARESIRRRPTALGHNMLGIALAARDDVAGARASYEKAIELEPRGGPPYSNLAILLERANDIEGAIALYRRSLALSPTGITWSNLGGLLSRTGDWSGAVAAWKEAVRLGREPAELHGRIGEALRTRIGDLDGAAAHFREAVRLSPGKTGPLILLGRALWEGRKGPEALGVLGRALGLAPGDAAVHEGIVAALGEDDPPADAALGGAAEVLLGRLERLRASAREMPPGASRTYLAALGILAAAGGGDRAVDLARREVAAAGSADAVLLDLLARVEMRAGRIRESLLTLEVAARLPGAPAAIAARLRDARESLLPDLATYGSIDAALEGDFLIPAGARWRWLIGREEPAAPLAWTRTGFDDRRWKEGPSGFGYGPGDHGTVLDGMQRFHTTAYLRRSFRVPDPGIYRKLILSVRIDDGFIAYLNGGEIGRFNVPGGPGKVLPRDATAASTIEPVDAPEIEIDPVLLFAGENVIAIQGLNRAAESSDLVILPVLRGEPEAPLPERFAAFRAAAGGADAPARIAYLEGRIEGITGRHDAAVPSLRRAAAAEPERSEPCRRLAESLIALGRLAEAEEALGSFLAARGDPSGEVLGPWLDLSLGKLGRGWAEVARRLPPGAPLPGSGPAADLAWAIRSLEGTGAIRIRSGGGELRTGDGSLWGADRFYRGGAAGSVAIEIEGTGDDDLYRAGRSFPGTYGEPSPAYSIPLPQGLYRVILHGAETSPGIIVPGLRVFDVFLEGVPVLVEHDLVSAAGWGRPDVREFAVAVDDGALDIGVTRRAGDGWISAIEVVRIGLEGFEALARRRVEASGGRDPIAFGELAEAHRRAGRPADAIAALEEASRLRRFPPVLRDRLAVLRAGILPDLATFASIDGAIESAVPGGPELDLARARDHFAPFRAAAAGPAAAPRRDYLDARLLALAGNPREALAALERIDAAGVAGGAIDLRIAECRRAIGDPRAAEARLRRLFESPTNLGEEEVSLWLALCFEDLGRSPSDALEALPRGRVPPWLTVVPASEESGTEWRITTERPPPAGSRRDSTTPDGRRRPARSASDATPGPRSGRGGRPRKSGPAGRSGSAGPASSTPLSGSTTTTTPRSGSAAGRRPGSRPGPRGSSGSSPSRIRSFSPAAHRSSPSMSGTSGAPRPSTPASSRTSGPSSRSSTRCAGRGRSGSTAADPCREDRGRTASSSAASRWDSRGSSGPSGSPAPMIRDPIDRCGGSRRTLEDRAGTGSPSSRGATAWSSASPRSTGASAARARGSSASGSRGSRSSRGTTWPAPPASPPPTTGPPSSPSRTAGSTSSFSPKSGSLSSRGSRSPRRSDERKRRGWQPCYLFSRLEVPASRRAGARGSLERARERGAPVHRIAGAEGVIFGMAGDLAKSGEALRRSIETTPAEDAPEKGKAMFNPGFCREQLGKIDEAAASYREAVRIGLEPARSRIHLARCLRKPGDFEGAAKVAIEGAGAARSLGSDGAEARAEAGRTRAAAGNLDEAIRWLEGAAKLAPEAYAEEHRELLRRAGGGPER